MVFLQVPLPTTDTNPWIWFTGAGAVVIGYLGRTVIEGYKERIARSEGREDKLLEDNRAQAVTIKEQSTTLLRVAGLAEDAVAAGKITHDKLDILLDRAPSNVRQRP